MGFGLLFIGYFVTYVMSYVVIPKLIGLIIMIVAMKKLSEYNTRFKNCIPVLGFMSVVSLYMLTYTILNHFGIESDIFGSLALNTVSTADEILNVVFHVFLTAAIVSIAKETELPKIIVSAQRDLTIVFMGEIAYLGVIVLKSFLPQFEGVKYIWYIAFILRILWIVLFALLIAKCYRMICDQNDKDMPEREIKIPIINKMEQVMRKRDENAFNAGKDFSEKRMEKKKRKKNKSK